MSKTRLEAFSDGVIAIIITIMVLELKVPHESSFESLVHILPYFFSYMLSFIFIAIYWVNHHHLLHTVTNVNSPILWANMNLLFWLSLIPFSTAWMGENNFTTNPVVVYAVLLVMCGIAYTILQTSIIKHHHYSEKLERAMKKHSRKGLISLVLYLLAVPFAFLHTGISEIIFVVVAIMWLIPDKNIEEALNK